MGFLEDLFKKDEPPDGMPPPLYSSAPDTETPQEETPTDETDAAVQSLYSAGAPPRAQVEQPGFLSRLLHHPVDTITGIPKAMVDASAQQDTLTQQQRNESRRPEGILGHVFDILSRPLYGLEKTVQQLGELGQRDFGDAPKAGLSGGVMGVLQALGAGLKEVVAPEDRLTTVDNIKQFAPDFAKNSPYATQLLGFMGDYVGNPTNLIDGPLAEMGTALGKSKLFLSAAGKARLANITEDIAKTYEALSPEMKAAEKLTPVQRAADKMLQFIADSPAEEAAKLVDKRPLIGFHLPFSKTKIPLAYGKAPNILEKLSQNGFAPTLQAAEDLMAQTAKHPDIAAIAQSSEGLAAKSQQLSKALLIAAPEEVPDIMAAKQVVDRNMELLSHSALNKKLIIPRAVGVKYTEEAVTAAAQAQAHTIDLGGKIAATEDLIKTHIDAGDVHLLGPLKKSLADLKEQKAAAELFTNPVAIQPTINFADKWFQRLTGSEKTPVSSITSLPSKVMQAKAVLFDRYPNIPEYTKDTLALQSVRAERIHNLQKDMVENVFGKMSNAERTMSGDYLNKYRSALRDTAITKYEGDMAKVTSKDIVDARRSVLNTGDLIKPENKAVRQAIIDCISQEHQVRRMAVQAGVSLENAKNSMPFIYDKINPAALADASLAAKSGTALTLEQMQQIRSLELARKVGLEPAMDGASVLSGSVAAMTDQLAKHDTDTTIKALFGVESLGERPAHIPARTWESIKRERDFILDPKGSLLKNVPSPMRNTYDMLRGINGLFRKLSVGTKLNFGIRQIPQNFGQILATLGVNTAGAFHPAAMEDAVKIMNYANEAGHELSWLAAKEGASLTKLNESIPIPEIVRQMKARGHLTGASAAGERMPGKLGNYINKMIAGAPISDTQKGMIKMMGKAMNFTNHAGAIEDFFHASTYANLLKQGYSFDQASSLTYKALNNYKFGYNAIERQILREVVPFYQFPKFAAKLITDVLGEKPGRLLTLQQGWQDALKVWGKANYFYNEAGGGMKGLRAALPFNAQDDGKPSELSDAERRVLEKDHSFILEQPYAYAGLSEDGRKKIFNTFNNYTFWDNIFMAAPEAKEGQADSFVGRMLRSALINMTPWAKLPIEIAMNKNVFTGQALSDPTQPGTRVKLSNPDDMLKAMANGLGASWGTAGLAAAQLLGPAAAALAPEEALKKLLGWETVQGPDGTQKTYMNPWLAYSASNLMPQLKTYIAYENPELSPSQKAMDVLFGVKTYSQDMVSGINYGMRKRQREIQAAQSAYKRALSTTIDSSGRIDDMRKHIEELLQNYQEYTAAAGNVQQ